MEETNILAGSVTYTVPVKNESGYPALSSASRTKRENTRAARSPQKLLRWASAWFGNWHDMCTFQDLSRKVFSGRCHLYSAYGQYDGKSEIIWNGQQGENDHGNKENGEYISVHPI